MRGIFLSLFLGLYLLGLKSSSQTKEYRYSKKGKLYFYWGWNNSAYSNSDIHFKGPNYNFTLENVVAKDRPTPLSLEYINPKTVTIPQYDFRIGYFISEKYSISIGNDHMKYVVKTGQHKKINGFIQNSNSFYDGSYDNQDIELSLDFLIFEHTDGLNYENIDLRRHERLGQKGEFTFDGFAGLGAGILYPRTNATLFKGKRYDEFNVAGYGISALAGLNMTFRGRFFIQSELKGGHINMPNIRISEDSREGASQKFYFFEYNLVFGVNIPIGKT